MNKKRQEVLNCNSFESYDVETLNNLYQALSQKIKKPALRSINYVNNLVSVLENVNSNLDKKMLKNKIHFN